MEYLAQYPESAEANCLVALIHGKLRRKKDAIDAAELAIHNAPHSPVPFSIAATVAYWFDEQTSALYYIGEWNKLEPGNPDMYSLLSAIEMQRQQLHAAQYAALKGIENQPNHAECHFRIGLVLLNWERHQEAEKYFRETLRFDAEHSGAQGFLANYEAQHGRYDLALPKLSNALLDYPEVQLLQQAWRQSMLARSALFRLMDSWLRLSTTSSYAIPSGLVLAILIASIAFPVRMMTEKQSNWMVEFPVALTIGASLTVVIWLAGHVVSFLIRQCLTAYYFLFQKQLRMSYATSESWRKAKLFLKTTAMMILAAVLYLCLKFHFDNAGK